MGISFKVSKTGKRYRPKPSFVPEETEPLTESSKESSHVIARAGSQPEVDVTDAAFGNDNILPEHEVSFTLNLYQKGYYIGKPTEIEHCQVVLQDAKSLHPYDRASETLFSAIESGWVPGGILDDIPSKYFDGTLICEIRDYRNSVVEQGTAILGSNVVPVVHKARLRMSLENVVKDMPLIADDSWTYSDLMEVEARILKALKPHLCLDPTPMLERLCRDPIVTKLNLGIGRKRRLQQISELTVTSDKQHLQKKLCLENSNCGVGEIRTQTNNASVQQVIENMPIQLQSSGILSLIPSTFGQDSTRPTLPLPSQSKLQTSVNSPTIAHDRSSGLPASFSGVNANMSSSHNLIGSHADAVSNPPISGKRENVNAQLTPLVGIKRPKLTPTGVDTVQQQHNQMGSQLVGLPGSDMQRRNQLLHSPLDTKGIHYASTLGGPRYNSTVINNMPNQELGASFYFNHQGVNYGSKEEQIDRQEFEKSKEAMQAQNSVNGALDQQQSRAQYLLQHSYMRNHPPAQQWQNARSASEKEMGKDETIQRRKSVPSPRVSSGPMVQSPVSSRSGEFSSGSAGGQFSGLATVSALGVQKDKLTSNPNAAVGAPSVTSSPSDSLHRQQQTSGNVKRKQNSITKTQAVNTVGSPASVSNMNPPLTASSPSIGTAPIGDQTILEKFVKIDAVAQRYQLNVKKNKIDDYPAKEPIKHSMQQLAVCLSESFNAEDYTDQARPMSRSLIGGTINTCKTRTMSFVYTERMYQVSTRLMMTEKPFDGTVSMQYGYMDDSDIQDYQLTLPTTHHADLLAAQFSRLMERGGYQKTEDQIRPIPIRMVAAPGSLPLVSAITSDTAASEMKPPELATGQSSQLAAPANTSIVDPMNPSQNPSSNTRMLTAANSNQTMAVAQGYLPGAAMSARMQQVDQSMFQTQQQQQQLQQTAQSQLQSQQQLPLTQMPRSNPLLSTNSLSQIIGQNPNLPIGTNQMVNNKPTPLQLQILQVQQQQHQQQQQQQQLPRKVVMGLNPATNMGNIGNNMMGLSTLNNVIGMGGIRGMTSPMSGLGNLSPHHQMNLVPGSNFNAGLPPNSLTQAQAAAIATKLRIAQQNRAGIYGQSAVSGLQGSTNQMHPSSAGLSMLGALNRGTMNPLQRSAISMSTMGPPKVPGAIYINPQQQLQQQPLQALQQQQQQPLQPQQQQQQQQQQMQQQISSPLQQTQVGSPPVVGSPPTMMMQHSQISQQMGQQAAMSPQQPSSCALQQLNNGGNPGAGPASPQLSSQTHGSVGSISSSPMEQLQGANKAGSASNV